MPTLCALGGPSELDLIAILSKKEETIQNVNNITSILARIHLITLNGPPKSAILFIK